LSLVRWIFALEPNLKTDFIGYLRVLQRWLIFSPDMLLSPSILLKLPGCQFGEKMDARGIPMVR
jgi:hypothetical protein